MKLDNLVLHPKTRHFVDKLKLFLPQGLIIDGPVGVGVTAVAKSLAQVHNSPDLVILPKRLTKNKQTVDMDTGRIIIDDMRLLYQETRTKQLEKHVYIIDTGQSVMTQSAQNALLKILEEPRPGLHFIITTHQYDKLLSTITSRCQRLSLPPVTDEQTATFLERLNIQDNLKKTRLGFIGRGLPALMTRLATDDTTYDTRVTIMQDAKNLLELEPYDKMKIIHRYRDNRVYALTLLDDMCHQLLIISVKQAQYKHIDAINRYIIAREAISNGGNVRLQLASAVL